MSRYRPQPQSRLVTVQNGSGHGHGQFRSAHAPPGMSSPRSSMFDAGSYHTPRAPSPPPPPKWVGGGKKPDYRYPSANNAANESEAVALAESVQRTFKLQQYEMTRNYQVSLCRAEAERLKQQKEYDIVVNERDILGTQVLTATHVDIMSTIVSLTDR